MNNNWQNELNSILGSKVQLQETSDFLKTLKLSGVSQNDVRAYLTAIRLNADEVIEDRILEMLDIVEGYCHPMYQVW